MADDGAFGERDETTGGALSAPNLILFALRRAVTSVTADFQIKVGGDDIRPSAFAVLAMLKQTPGLTQSQISPVLGMRRTNLVPLLSDLERRGLAERRPVAGDRRASALFLTDQGRDVYDRCAAGCADHEAALAGRLGAAGRAQLLMLLHRLTDSAVDAPGCGDGA